MTAINETAGGIIRDAGYTSHMHEVRIALRSPHHVFFTVHISRRIITRYMFKRTRSLTNASPRSRPIIIKFM